MQKLTNATDHSCYRLLYLAGTIRTAKAMAAGSDHKCRCILLFYAVKYFKAVKVEGITPEEVEQLQGGRNLWSDVPDRVDKTGRLDKGISPIIKGQLENIDYNDKQ